MKIVSVQLDIIWENKSANYARVKDFVARANRDQADLIVFPEMFNSGFSMKAESIAEPQNTSTSHFLCQLAKQYRINIIAGFVETRNERAENIALAIGDDGTIKTRYIKNYPFSFAGEDKVYATGDKTVLFDINGCPSSLFICYDLRFPEHFRQVAKQAEIIFVIANWPETRQQHWETLLKARAIENQCFVVGVNRIGKDGNNLIYGGGSQVYNPLGQQLSNGASDQEYIITEIDPSEVSAIRKKLPFLDDMKI